MTLRNRELDACAGTLRTQESLELVVVMDIDLADSDKLRPASKRLGQADTRAGIGCYLQMQALAQCAVIHLHRGQLRDAMFLGVRPRRFDCHCDMPHVFSLCGVPSATLECV